MLAICDLTREALPRAVELFAKACLFDPAHRVAEELLFGAASAELGAQPIGAYVREELVGVACTSGKWLRVLAVDPKHRARGVGTALVERCEEAIRAHAPCVRLLDQPGNYLAPGIDVRNRETIEWFERRGYKTLGSACNLVVDLTDNALISSERLAKRKEELARRGFVVDRLGASCVQSLTRRVVQAFSSGWAYQVRRASAMVPSGVHVATVRDTGEFAGFSVRDGNNQGLGWFGPMGTFPEFRGNGVGGALLLQTMLDVQKQGHKSCEVAWIGPREFYQKHVGIQSERHFCVMGKELIQ